MAGPIEALNYLARFPGFEDMSLSVIAPTTEPINPGPIAPDTSGRDFVGVQHYLPTHTFDNVPPLDVLIVPGGLGVKANVGDAVPFIRNTYYCRDGHPPLKYLISVCNGAFLVAQSRVLDGRKATTSRAEWDQVTVLGKRTHWIAKARWVAGGNIWTTSGVSAGLDGVIAWLLTLVPSDVVSKVLEIMK